MRADVARREAELAVPLRQRTERAEQRANSEAGRREAAERALGAKFLPDISARTAHLFARKAEEEIARACSVAMRSADPAKDVTITLPVHVVAYSDPRSVVSMVLERWRIESLPDADVYAMADPMKQYVSTVTVRMPELSYRYVVSN
jgi:hypothetical protein